MSVTLRWLCGGPLCFALFGCAGNDAPAPETAIDSTIAVSVCADGDGVTSPGTNPSELDLQWTGTVSEVGTGDVAPCPSRGRLTMDSRRLETPPLPPASWLRVRSVEGRELLLAIAAPGFAPSIHAGDALHVEAQSRTFAFAPSREWLELRDENGQLLFWYGEAGTLAELKTPDEVSLSEGEVQAQPATECFPVYQQKRLDAEIAGASGSIGWSEQGAVGDWLVTNLSVTVPVSLSTCADAFISSASAALWPLSASDPP